MENFVYHNPTKVLFGKGTTQSIGQETALLGQRVLLVSGRVSAKKNGVYQQVTESLIQAGVEITEFTGVSSNPVLSHVHSGIALAKENGCDVVCGVGGGSVLDEAKAIGAGALVNHDVWKFFTGKKSVKGTLPLTCVLTLAASGSEMNSGMVVTNDQTNQKFGFANRHLFPKTSILNPETTYTVPPNYTAFGAVDAIAHLLEVYFTTQVNPSPVHDRFIEGLVTNIMDSCNRALKEPQNYKARAELMWTATLALNGLTTAGLGKVGFPMHLIEHSLSALHDIPHGAGLAVVIPGWMKYQLRQSPGKFRQFSQRIFGLTSDDENVAILGVDALQNWFTRIGCPTSLRELEIPELEIPLLAENTIALSRVWRMREYNPKIIEEILYLCL